MPMDYLRKIENAALPFRVGASSEINCIAILKAAGLIEAAILPPSGVDGTSSEPEYDRLANHPLNTQNSRIIADERT